MQFRNKKILFIIAGVFLVLVFMALSIDSKPTTTKNPDLNSGQYYDAKSRQTVSNPKDKGPDTYGVSANDPVFLGLDRILDNGLTSDQYTSLKFAFIKYATESNIKEISVDTNTFKPLSPTSDSEPQVYTLLFDLTLDRKKIVSTKITYSGMYVVHLYLIEKDSNKTIFDSGELGGFDDVNG